MIVADKSALVAIVLNEPERAAFLGKIASADLVLVSAVSAVEVRLVVYGRKGHRGVVLVDDLLRQPEFEIVPAGAEEAAAAYAAFVTYGKGSGHPAALNICDLFSYALAKSRSLPLLFKGDDFAKTDIEQA